jgi:LAS superfamily LD-carboxypeptidase LdcB
MKTEDIIIQHPDQLKDSNEETYESTASTAAWNSQEYLVKVEKKQKENLKYLSQEDIKIEQIFKDDPFPERSEAADIFLEFPEIIIFQSIPFNKGSPTTLNLCKDPNLIYKWTDSKRIGCVGRIKFFLNSKNIKVNIDHSKPLNEHKNIMLSLLNQRTGRIKAEKITKSKLEEIACDLLSQNKHATTTDMMNAITRKFGSDVIFPWDIEISSLLKSTYSVLYTHLISQWENELTMISEQFGRPSVRFFNKHLQKPEHALILHSPFQNHLLSLNVSLLLNI